MTENAAPREYLGDPKAKTEKPTAAKAPARPVLVTIGLDTEIGRPEYDHCTGECVGPGATIAETIVDLASQRLVAELKDEVARVAIAKIDVARVAIAKVDAQITSQVRDLVAAVLAEPFQVTDQWGSSRGKSTTIRERIAEQVTLELKPVGRDSYSNRDQPVITAVIEVEVRQALTAELRSIVQAARDKVVGAVRDQAAELIAKAVKDGLRS